MVHEGIHRRARHVLLEVELLRPRLVAAPDARARTQLLRRVSRLLLAQAHHHVRHISRAAMAIPGRSRRWSILLKLVLARLQ